MDCLFIFLLIVGSAFLGLIALCCKQLQNGSCDGQSVQRNQCKIFAEELFKVVKKSFKLFLSLDECTEILPRETRQCSSCARVLDHNSSVREVPVPTAPIAPVDPDPPYQSGNLMPLLETNSINPLELDPTNPF
uniref:Secreted protein n=1 Tax=Lutzomyia longipalpis TaxID=7200 RepID=A0A1B0C9H5_LUTLO